MDNSKRSQKQKIKSHLESYGSITSMKAFQYFSITRLAAIIHTLRNDGMDIKTEMRWTPEHNYAVYLHEAGMKKKMTLKSFFKNL